MSLNSIKELYPSCKENSLRGRYIHFDSISEVLRKYKSEVMGSSENHIPIHRIRIGNGLKKVLIWTQMHGNESTGTKAVFDLLNFLNIENNTTVQEILRNCSLSIIPIVNPDGAKAYTRENANHIDLNRDAVLLDAKESRVLRKELEEFDPLFCFNMHDQRTIFGVGDTPTTAALSFLAPSTEKSRKITEGRRATMNVISNIYTALNKELPGMIGRYTDEFYPSATGDNFQKMGYNTILVESGHYPKDYEREITRKYTFLSLVIGLHHIATQEEFTTEGEYFNIPNLSKSFCDLIHRYPDGKAEAFQFREHLRNNQIHFIPEKIENPDLNSLHTHKEIVFVD